MAFSLNINDKQESSDDHKGSSSGDDFKVNSLEGANLSTEKFNTAESNHAESMETGNGSLSIDSGLEGYSAIGLQALEQSNTGSVEKRSAANAPSETKLVDSSYNLSMEAVLQGKPKRLDQSVKGMSNFSREEMAFVNPQSCSDVVGLENFIATSLIKITTGEGLRIWLGQEEEKKWNLLVLAQEASLWKFLAFDSWLRRKGLEPSKYKQNLGIMGIYGIANETSLDSSQGLEVDKKIEIDISTDMKLEDLLGIYDQEKLKFLSSFVGQKIKVNVVMADRKSRSLIFSMRPKEKEEMVEKKRSVMAKLSIGDVVKCCIRKITYFGIFVEVEGVPALIHHTEVSWDPTLDPASYFKVGQIVEAKVHQLDFSIERIFLSLMEIAPDPLIEALEAVIGDPDSLDGRLEASQADTEWADVELLIKELRKFEGIQYISKGHFFLSPGLAPTFQVYTASMFENEYKLLARSGNRVQEVMVQTSLGKEEMKCAIQSCPNRVE